jgi:hypothetical protein
MPNTFLGMINKILVTNYGHQKLVNENFWLPNSVIGKLGVSKFLITKNGSTKKFRSQKKWSMFILTNETNAFK